MTEISEALIPHTYRQIINTTCRVVAVLIYVVLSINDNHTDITIIMYILHNSMFYN